MSALLSWWRIGAALAVAMALAASHWSAYTRGRDLVQLQWDADTAQRTAHALAAEQSARAAEKEMADKVKKVSQAYAAEKDRRVTADRAAADSLRRLEAALAGVHRPAGADTGAAARADDDPRDRIIAECAGALVGLDSAYQSLAGKNAALQGYTREVCLTPQH